MNTSDFSTVLRVLPASGQSCLSIESINQKVVFKDESESGDGAMPGLVAGEFSEFCFDGVFHNVDQLSFFRQTVKVTVEQMLQGYHGTVFALGARDSGARHTMRGTSFGSELQLRAGRGAMLRAVELVFHCLRRSTSRATKGLVVIVSYLTIRNEEAFDLFGQTGEENVARVVLDKFGELRGLSEHVVSSAEDVECLLRQAYKKEQHIAEKALPGDAGNAVFTITVEHGNLGKTFAPISGVLRLIELSNFTQLADDISRRSVNSALPEGRTNKSLWVLLQIIRRVAELQTQYQRIAFQPETCSFRLATDSHGEGSGKMRPEEVERQRKALPFEQSLLTRLVGESIGGNGKTLLVCHVSADASDSQMTGRLLQLASVSQLITNYPDRRDLAEQALMSAYLRELRQNYRHVVIDRSDEAATDKAKSLTTEESASPREKKRKGKRKAGRKSLQAGDVVWDPETMGKRMASKHRRKSEPLPASQSNWEAEQEAFLADLKEPAKENNVGSEATAESAAEALAAAAALVEEADLTEAALLEEEEIDSKEKETTSRADENGETCESNSNSKPSEIKPDNAVSCTGADTQSTPLPTCKTDAEKPLVGIAAVIVGDTAKCSSEGKSRGEMSVAGNNRPGRKVNYNDQDNEEKYQVVQRDNPTDGKKTATSTQVQAETDIVLNEITTQEQGRTAFASKETAAKTLEQVGSGAASKETKTGVPSEQVEAVPALKDTSVNSSGHTRKADASKKMANVSKQVEMDRQAELQQSEAKSGTDEHLPVRQSVIEQLALGGVHEAIGGSDTETLLKVQDLLLKSISASGKRHEGDSTYAVCTGQQIVECLEHVVTGIEDKDEVMWLADDLLRCGVISCANNDNGAFSTSAEYCVGMTDTAAFSGSAAANRGTKSFESTGDGVQSMEQRFMEVAYQGDDYGDLIYDYTTGQPYVPQVHQDSSALERNVIDQKYISLEPFNPDRVSSLSDKLHPFHSACATGQNPLMLRNLAIMFGVDLCDLNGRSALMYAVLSNKPKCIAELLECGAAADRIDTSGFTALLHAVSFNFVPVVQELLSHEESRRMIAMGDPDGLTAIHWATKLGSVKCLHLLLRHCLPGQVNMMDNLCQTPLYLAVAQDRYQHVGLLLGNSGDPSAVDAARTPAYHLAVACHAPHSLKVLLSLQKNSVNQVDTAGQTALHVACIQRCGECFDIILKAAGKKWPGVSKADSQQRTPLHCAVDANCPGLVKELLVRGAALSARNSQGQTALECAENTNSICLPVLREATATIAAGKRYTGGQSSSTCTIS